MPTGIYTRTKPGWNKGKHWSPEMKLKLSIAHKDQKPYVRTEAIKQKATGENSGTWKGDKVGYQGIHRWLNKTFGKVDICEICGITETSKKKYFHWALLKGKSYERKRENFWKLCLKCHRNYDGTNPTGRWKKGKI